MRKLLTVTGACVVLMGCGGIATTFAASGPVGGSAQRLPGDAVAIVDGDPVTKAEYDRWFAITVRSEPSATDGAPIVPDPPSYRRCIAALKERAGTRKAPSDAQLEVKCRTRERRARQQTMALLIQSIWFEKEAEALGVGVSDARVEQLLRKAKRESFRNARDYRRFLRVTGMTEDDVRFRLRVNELGTAISRHVQRGAGKDKAKRLEAFGRQFQKRWVRQTECRAGYVIRSFCGNA